MRPEVGSVSRLIMRSSVDLPAPDRPMMPTICPVGTVKETLLTATRPPNDFVNPSIFSIKLPSTSSLSADQSNETYPRCHSS